MKLLSLELLAGLAAAAQNVDDNDCAEFRSCWTAVEVKHLGDWPECFADADCEDDHYCISHMWEYNHQKDAGKGCWKKEVCSGNGAYVMFEERKIQWFCSDEQLAANAGASPPWPLMDPAPEVHWTEWEATCASDEDCPRPDLGQVCTLELWEGVSDGSSFSNGSGCYNYEVAVCPG